MNFMNVEQYQFVKKQAKKVMNTYITTKDPQVIQAIQELVSQEVNEKLGDMSVEHVLLLQPILKIETKEQLEQFTDGLKQYVEPFEKPSEAAIKKLFPKDKKLKIPALEKLDLREMTYLSWVDSGTNRKYLVYWEADVLKGVRGVFSHTGKKGICSICNQLSNVGLLMVSQSGTSLGTYKKRGNYICADSLVCNDGLTERSRLADFMNNLK